jgi:hypothetical protein
MRKTSIIKLQVQKSNSERPTSTRLEVRTYMTKMLGIIFTQGTEKVITRNLPTTKKTVVMLMGNTPLRGYPF